MKSEVRAQSNTVGRLWFFSGGGAREHPGGLLRLDPAFAYAQKYDLSAHQEWVYYLGSQRPVHNTENLFFNLMCVSYFFLWKVTKAQTQYKLPYAKQNKPI